MSTTENEMRARNRRRLVGMGLLAPQRYTELTGEQAPSMHDRVDANTPSLDDLKRELASLQSPEERRKQTIAEATAQRDKDLQFLASAEALAKAGAGPEVEKAITAQYQEERRKVAEKFERVRGEVQRQEAVRSSSRAGAQHRLIHGTADSDDHDRFDHTIGMIAGEAQRRRREVEDRFEQDLAAAELADQKARNRGRLTSHTQPVRDRIAGEIAKVDRWERSPDAESWAQQRVESRRTVGGEAAAEYLAARRRDLADQIARHPDNQPIGG